MGCKILYINKLNQSFVHELISFKHCLIFPMCVSSGIHSPTDNSWMVINSSLSSKITSVKVTSIQGLIFNLCANLKALIMKHNKDEVVLLLAFHPRDPYLILWAVAFYFTQGACHLSLLAGRIGFSFSELRELLMTHSSRARQVWPEATVSSAELMPSIWKLVDLGVGNGNPLGFYLVGYWYEDQRAYSGKA